MKTNLFSLALRVSLTSAAVAIAAAACSSTVDTTESVSQADDTRFLDNRQTILWQDLMPHTDGTVGNFAVQAGIWHYDPTTGYVETPTFYDLAPAYSSLLGAANFRGTGNPFLLWSAGSAPNMTDYWVWDTSGLTVTGKTLIGSVASDWAVVGTIDTDGDGKEDIVWRSQATGALGVWLMDGSYVLAKKILGGVAQSTKFAVRALGRFDGSNAFALLQDSGTGAVYVSELNGLAGVVMDRRSVSGPVANEWALVGAADFDGDGKTDILWHNRRTGDAGIWKMSWYSFTYAYPGNASPDWVPVKAADIFGYGRAGIVWRNKFSGEVKVWSITQSLTLGYSVSFGDAPCEWRIVGDPSGVIDNQCIGPQRVGAPCGNGLTCVADANCFQGICTAKNVCGTQGGQCCAGTTRSAECPGTDDLGHPLDCNASLGCISCGVKGRPCCTGSTCTDGSTCAASPLSPTGWLCGTPPPPPPQGPCGHGGQECCRAGIQCPGDGNTDAHTLQCNSAGKCERCGIDGGKCCRTDDTHHVCYYIDSVCPDATNVCVGSHGLPSTVDLVPAQFWTVPSSLRPDEPFTLFWVDGNSGTSASGPYTDEVSVYEFEQPDPVRSDPVSMPALPGGGRSTIHSLDYKSGLKAGAHIFELDVNFNDTTPESNYFDNQSTFQLVVQ